MTEPTRGPVEPPTLVWVPQEPFQAQPFDQQQGHYPPPPPLPDLTQDVVWPSQNTALSPGVRPLETKSPLIALVCGVLGWVICGAVVIGAHDLVFGLLLPIPAIIFGVKGRREARQGRTSHKGRATAGIWLGSILGVLTLLTGSLVVLVFVVLQCC